MAVLLLVFEGTVNWKYGSPMAVGGLLGGYLGGMVVRAIVIAIGFTASTYYFWKLYARSFGRIESE